MKYYYLNGYGNMISKRLGCPLAKDLFERFERAVNGDESAHKVVAYFSNSATLQSLLVALDIAKDDQPLYANNYFTQSRRRWATSKISPFAGNLAAVLYQ